MSVQICCEGPDCNGGRSAIVRETEQMGDLRGINETMRDEYAKHARAMTSRSLVVTSHTPSGITRRAGIVFALYACEACHFERIYGNSVVYQ